MRASQLLLISVFVGLSLLIAATSSNLISSTRFGLEFRGGYEIYYVVEPIAGETSLLPDALLNTANILRKRADSFGMAEPEVTLEGKNHIRLKMAGETGAKQLRSTLGDPTGLPAKLTEKYTQTVGSVLGNTALNETVTAGAIGMGLVFLLLIILYRLAGVMASFCLVVYLWLLLVAFNAMHATLSLSAVVAFVLGIGIAADATIISLERICEELRRNSDVPEAFRKGFHNSFRTIRDANIVTLIAMIVLFVAGIGPIQGFSITMVVSMVISIVTNVFLVRFLCELAIKAGIPIPLLLCRIRSAREEAPRVFDFVGIGKKIAVLAVFIIITGAWYYSNHGLNLDIDFTAGTALDIDIDKSIEQAEAEKIMTEAGTVPATVSIGGDGDRHIAARFDEILKPEELGSIIDAFKAKYGSGVNYEENTADPGVAREFATKAIYALAAACASIVLFIAFRFSWPVAIATLISIVHDLLLVCAIFSLFKLEIDVTYIAAMLTVMGYSLNDKIVIFDRVRENLAMESQFQQAHLEIARRVANLSIRQTLGRSIYTVLTVVLASSSILAFACEPLQMFSLAILLGLIFGTYSSIFLACPLWIAMRVTRRAEVSSTKLVRI